MRQTETNQLFIQIRALQAEQEGTVRSVTKLQQSVLQQNQTFQQLSVVSSPMVNVIRNSDWNYSALAYTGSGVNTDAAHWYSHYQIRVTDAKSNAGSARITCATSLPFTTTVFGYGTIRAVLYGAKADGSTMSSTLTRVSDSQADMTSNADIDAEHLELWICEELDETTTQALKTAPTTLSKWDKATGTALVGATNTDTRFTLDQPLATNSATPSSRQYFQINARFTTGTVPAGLSMYMGLWDATSGKQRWLEGDNFTLTAQNVGSHAGGATVRIYRVVATTDYGYQLQSNDVSVSDTIDPLTSASYVALEWTNLVGVNTYDIYMFNNDNGQTYLVTTINNGSYTYFDDGPGTVVPTGFPIITSTKWRAFVELVPNQFAVNTETWITVRASIMVPNTYGMSGTTGKQWLRIGILGDAGALAVKFDHVGLCAAPSNAWNISPLDQNASGAPDGNSDNDDQGPIGGGGPIFPPGQGGDGTCVSIKEVWLGKEGKLYIDDLEEGTLIADGLGGFQPISKITQYEVPSSAIIYTEDGASLQASLSHPVMQSLDDYVGKTVFQLEVGDDIVTSDGITPWVTKVTKKVSGGPCTVAMIALGPNEKRFMAGHGPRKIVGHNTKPIMPQGQV